MKVLHVISGLKTGGAEVFLERLALGLANRDISQTIVALRDAGDAAARLERAGIRVRVLHAGLSPAGLKALFALRSMVREQAPDLIQGWLYYGNLGASLARRLGGARSPVLWNVRHSLDDWRNESTGLRAMVRLSARASAAATRIVYNSAVAARQHERHGYRHDKTLIIPNGVDCNRFRPDAALRHAMRQRLGLDADAITIGMVARFHPVKDHATFLKAAHIVRARVPRSRFLLVGHGTSRDNPALAALLKRHQLDESVLPLGERQDICALLNALDVHVSASRAEGFPNAVGEAMACGVPCVATDVGASRELLGETGELVQPGSQQELAEAIIKVAVQSTSQRHDLGKAARERVIRLYSVEQCILAYADLYESLATPTILAVNKSASRQEDEKHE